MPLAKKAHAARSEHNSEIKNYLKEIMNVWVFNDPDKDWRDVIYESLKNGISRFEWLWFDSADLCALKTRAWQEYNKDEKEARHRANFLLGIEHCDWIVHVNVPQWEQCAAVQVTAGGEYDFEYDSEFDDFRHTLGVDTASFITFDRNDWRVLPNISRRLKLQGVHWQISEVKDFFASIANLKNKSVELAEIGAHAAKSSTENSKSGGAGKSPFEEDLEKALMNIAALIHKHHLAKTR
ncbi:hypothetical protein [Treponema endosymbiont of Eucomonympha sp.]|uniref:hypothetical protein n=1 Tax=Treponema endosymbiont of Eucomonympha sp. TaxID=1580831 RepID=UPI001E655548|nr:hypothetical protein [Treponema endosymbiont of Eucomonympha sp.]